MNQLNRPDSTRCHFRQRISALVVSRVIGHLAWPVIWLAVLGQATFSATFTVTNTDNSGAGSLRQAIIEANRTAEVDSIHFNIPGTGPHTISLASALPDIIRAMKIDGTTQPGFAGKPVIELDGSAVPDADGLWIQGGNSTVRGLAINGFRRQSGSFRRAAIFLGSNVGNVIEGNFLGVDPTGTQPVGNQYGLIIESSLNNLIGGTNAAARNVISGNSEVNVFIFNAPRNVVQGNLIGTDVTGTLAIGGSMYGVMLVSGTSDNLIGGTNVGARNIISGHTVAGIAINGTGPVRNRVEGNFIGTDASGLAAVGNRVGIAIAAASRTTIGGTIPEARNLISGNEIGVSIVSQAASNSVQGNYIGTDVTGRSPLGNDGHGVYIDSGRGSLIGGAEPGAGNVIAFNAADGIYVSSGAANLARGNVIFGNQGLGIDLDEDGVTPNDPGDNDVRANLRQNYPLFSSATTDGSMIHLQGTLNSKSGATFALDFYGNTACSASGHGEGQVFIGSSSVMTAGNGDVKFDFAFPSTLGPGQFVTATATDAGNNTSEFSQCIQVTAGASPPKLSVMKSASGRELIFSWPSSAAGFVLEETDRLSTPTVWSAVQPTPTIIADRKSLEITPAMGARFYRIRKPN